MQEAAYFLKDVFVYLLNYLHVCMYVTHAHIFVCVTVCHTSMRVLMPVDTPGGQKKALGVVFHNSPLVSEAGFLSEPSSVSASPSNHPVSASLKFGL